MCGARILTKRHAAKPGSQGAVGGTAEVVRYIMFPSLLACSSTTNLLPSPPCTPHFLQDTDNYSGFVEFMDADKGAGWQLLEALMKGQTAAGELLRTANLFAAPRDSSSSGSSSGGSSGSSANPLL
jgi:hypothetical protein